MRILHIGYRLPPEPGGKERYIECLSREQLLRGHEVIVAHRRGEPHRGARTLPLARTSASLAVSRKSDVIAFAMECARALPRAHGIDVVHAHGDHCEALGLGAVARRLGIPLVLHVHGALNVRHRRIMPWAFRYVDGFIVSGTRPRKDLLAAGIPDRRIRMVPSGLDLGQLTQFRGKSPVERGLIVSVGSLVEVKNHALTIKAFHELRTTHPDARLVIAGDGRERARLEQLAGADSGVEFAGQIAADHVYSLVSRAHAFVHASHRFSTIGEGIPTAPLEALALGAAVIVSSDASLDPAIMDDAAYRVFRSGSREELVTHLRSVLDDEVARLQMVERGVQTVSNLGWPTVAGHIEEWYETFMTSGTPRQSMGVS